MPERAPGGWRRAVGAAWPTLRRLALQMAVATALLVLGGVGFWWLEPTAPRLSDGLWLAFATASTIGYGDVVPTTPSARLLAVPVLLLGFAVLSSVTAAIAATWIESQERRIEREILRDVHGQLRQLRQDLAALFQGTDRAPHRGAGGGPERPAAGRRREGARRAARARRARRSCNTAGRASGPALRHPRQPARPARLPGARG